MTAVLQPRGEPLTIWWPEGVPEYVPVVLLAEGEGDALAVISALAERPQRDLPEHAVAALPGTGFPVKRLLSELVRIETRLAYLAFDADEAGNAYAERVAVALAESGVGTARLGLPTGEDIAEHLSQIEVRLRGFALASLLCEARARRRG